ncbi:hypothetical protein HYS47_00695 [Candidatus Woesearchaeota archaeon]|nr:hypothetical protein [Candidatus Woesearchaeota archaeon]
MASRKNSDSEEDINDPQDDLDEDSIVEHDEATGEDDALDVSKATKKEKKKEREIAEKVDANQEMGKVGTKSNWYFFILFGIVVLAIALIIFAPSWFGNDQRQKTMDELHEENLLGKLPPEQGYLYNGFSFVKFGDGWYTRFIRQGTDLQYNVQLRYGPRDVLHVPVEGNISSLFKYNATYITFDPTEENLSHVALAAADLSTSLYNILNVTPVAACMKNETNGCRNRPIITCKDPHPTIAIVQASTPSVTIIGNCVIVQGREFGLLEAVDRLLLAWFNIMP